VASIIAAEVVEGRWSAEVRTCEEDVAVIMVSK
jgi:hypothetical protein